MSLSCGTFVFFFLYLPLSIRFTCVAICIEHAMPPRRIHIFVDIPFYRVAHLYSQWSCESWIWYTYDTYCVVSIVIFDFVSVLFFVLPFPFGWRFCSIERNISQTVSVLFCCFFFIRCSSPTSSSSCYFATTFVLYVSQWFKSTATTTRSLFYIDKVNSLIFKLKVGFLWMPMAQQPEYTESCVASQSMCALRKLTSFFWALCCAVSGFFVSLQVYRRRLFGVFAVRLNVRWAEAICGVYAAEWRNYGYILLLDITTTISQ